MTRRMLTLLLPALPLLALFSFGMLLAGAHVANAATDASASFVPLAEFSGSSKLADIYKSKDLATFIGRLFFASISLGAILAVLRLSWAGYQYMGSDLWGNKEHAKEIIRDTLLGLFLLLSIYLILYQINPDILDLNATKVIESNPVPPENYNPGPGSGSAY